MERAQLEDIGDGLFEAFANHDLDTAATMMAPNAVFTQNGRSFDWETFRSVLVGTLKWIGNHRYEEVRRVYDETTIVEEHMVRSTTTDGATIELSACVVIRVNADGKITAIDEYVDTSSLT